MIFRPSIIAICATRTVSLAMAMMDISAYRKPTRRYSRGCLARLTLGIRRAALPNATWCGHCPDPLAYKGRPLINWFISL